MFLGLCRVEWGATGREGRRDSPAEAPQNRDPQGLPRRQDQASALLPYGLELGSGRAGEVGGRAAAFPFAPEFLKMKNLHLPAPEKLAVQLGVRSQLKVQFLVLRCEADPPGETLAFPPLVLRPREVGSDAGAVGVAAEPQRVPGPHYFRCACVCVYTGGLF